MVLFLVLGPSDPCADRAFLVAEALLVNLYREVVAHPYHLAYHFQDQILDHGLKVLGVLSVGHLYLQVYQVLLNIFPSIHKRQLMLGYILLIPIESNLSLFCNGFSTAKIFNHHSFFRTDFKFYIFSMTFSKMCSLEKLSFLRFFSTTENSPITEPASVFMVSLFLD